ncbi:FAD-dependent monooxygenase [Streptomyces sp. ODS28]|uniref:FAD-dependent monooxygenase n=1 Tax=Streptomyces sp. ODS28 TaxID=3136688 RepID=UPI0031EA4E1B
MTPDVLVAGAGPTGLALALQAHAHGARVRVIERRAQATRPSHALLMHPGTLEALRPLQVTRQLLSRAHTVPAIHLHTGSHMVPLRLAALAVPGASLPAPVLLHQADVEAVLGTALEERGVRIERNTELVELSQTHDGVQALLRSRTGVQQARCGFLAGCDGRHSTVRVRSGIGWHDGMYPEEVVLADAELGGLPSSSPHVAVARRGIAFAFPYGERAGWRVLATRRAEMVPPWFGHRGPPVAARQLQLLLRQAGLAVTVRHVAWSEAVRVQHRVAARFRQGRVFLAGDAAHAQSPALGQGMNTGIQDALNLGWKLAYDAGTQVRGPLLESYESERQPVARHQIAVTDLAFRAEASTSLVAVLLRGTLAPLLRGLPLLMPGLRFLAPRVRRPSPPRVNYRHSPLSVEAEPRLRGRPRCGERLPDSTVRCEGREVALHALVASPGVHVLLGRDAPPLEPSGPHVTVHRLDRPGGAILALRPDGYVGYRSARADTAALHRWLTLIGALRGGEYGVGSAADCGEISRR